MGKIIKSAYNPNSYNMLSQTPKNYVKDNYYLRTLQDKVDADWEYRPNRVDIEEESVRGSLEYVPMEAVVQSVRNDKGEKVSEDIMRLVFRDIRYSSKIGTKYRFSFNFDLEEPDEDKFIWLVTNREELTPTASSVITRCNGTIASTYKDENGVNQIHYEPVISATALSSTNFHFDEAIVTAKADLTMIVQYNQYTMNYYINQRFIVGPNQVYKVSAIQNTNSLATFKPEDIGLMVLYANFDQLSEQDNLETRLAYNKPEEQINPSVPDSGNGVVFKITEPSPLPTELYSEPIIFKAGLYFVDTLDSNTEISIECDLDVNTDPLKYFDFEKIDGNSFMLRRKKIINRNLKVKVYIEAAQSPSGEEMSQEFELFLGGLE